MSMGKKNILRSGFFNADRVTLLTVTAVFLFLTAQDIEKRRWN